MARILLVEDDELVCRSLRMTLEAYGHMVENFADGRKAVELLRQQGDFDAVITDILMPDMDGLELIRAVRALAPGIRVIAMSGGGRRGNQDFLQFASTFGADAVLSKPFTGETLVDTLATVLKP
ncbi:response regulator [Ferrovibrio sp. MS7]|uniref:response regulator n=1 Tax=Ferrovibrio plantarum TaxID=3119164 RepID=UPI003135C757